ncbi:MAG: UvrD-helicase domain-containing protein, partial [Proteobacteria bacterium]|nr:UvrD-helicase domain-containing protein [Pseudomonadota bacterium]
MVSNIGIDDVKLISASAGTGKTTRLVDEIVRALDQYSASRIVAVTFTNAAVRDLKDKIEIRLKDSPKKDSAKDITVSTIHSFFAQILREQSMKLNISPTFEIIGDTAAPKIIFSRICKDVISKKIVEEEYKNIFLEYSLVELMGIMGKLENKYSFIRRNIKRTYSDFLELEKNGEAKKLYQLTGKDFIHKVLDVLIDAECPEKPCTLTEARAAMLQNIKALKTALQEFIKDAETQKFSRNALKNVCQILKNIIPPMTVRSSKGMEDIYNAYKVLKEASETVEELRIGDDYVSEQAAGVLEKLVKLFAEIHEGFAREKRRMESLDYNDIELMTYDLIHNHPQMAEYYKAKYSYILVDEFQDTNNFQSDVLFKISKKLFLVGDAKQSIYRFRNADVRVFVDTQKKISSGVVEELKSNFRSRKSIVDTVNAGFEILFDKWTQDKQSFDPEYMKMDMGKTYDGDGMVRFFNVGDPEKKSASVELEALCTADLINDRVNYGRDFGDFAILFRTKSSIPVFEKFLIKNEIPYVVWGDTDKSQIIERLMSLFGFVVNPYNDFDLLQTVKLPPFYIADECIYKLRKDNEYLWAAISGYDLSENKYDFSKKDILSIESLKLFFNRCEKLAHRGGNFTEYVARVLAYSDFIPSMEAIYPEREIGLEEMILKIAQDVEETGGTLSDFLEFLSMSMSDKNDLEVEGAVKLMTVHASKGLDFPIVIMPCLHNTPPRDDLFVVSSDGDISLKLRNQFGYDRKPTPYHSFIKEDEDRAELAESKRLFYVA